MTLLAGLTCKWGLGKKKLVSRAGCHSNKTYVSEFISKTLLPKKQTPDDFAAKYLKNGFTVKQMAEEIGVAKSTALRRLRDAGVQTIKGRGTSPDNYRYKNPPFGFKLKEGRLVPNSKEMRIARLVVELRERQKETWEAISKALNEKNYRTRTGAKWSLHGARFVYMKWAEKL